MVSIYTGPLESFEPRGRPFMDVHPQDDGTDDDNLAASILSNTPRLAKSTTSPAFTAKQDELWRIRAVANGEEELFARDKCLYWTNNSLIKKSFNFTDQVTQAFWASFNGKDHVCVALTSGISIFDKTGQHFQIPLPFAHSHMYATKLGLVIGRYCEPIDDSTLPTLFALTHPTQEISPILFKQSSQKLTYLISASISIIACHDRLPLCLMYDSDEDQHSIWKIRPTTEQEVEAFQRMNDDSTTFTHHQSSCSFRDGSLNVSSKQKSSLLHQSNPSTLNYSPKIDTRSKHSNLGNLAASRLGLGAGPEGQLTTTKSFNNSMSTLNRNRIINYLRDNIEEPILPQITYEQIWIEGRTSALNANKFFSTFDLVDDEYLVIVSTASSRIKMMKCERLGEQAAMSGSNPNLTSKFDNDNIKLGKSFTIAATDAASIPSLKMMLVVDIHKNMVLYSGTERLTTIIVPQPPQSGLKLTTTSSPASYLKSSGGDMTPIQMSSARKRTSMGERSSIGSDLSFQQMFQALSPVPHAVRPELKISTPVTSSDVKKIEYIINQTAYVQTQNNQRAKFHIPSISQTNYVTRLLNSMKILVPRDVGVVILTKWYQIRRSSTQPELMKALDEIDLFKNWFLSCIGVIGVSFKGEHNMIALSPTKKTRRAKDSENNAMINNLHTLFYGMHLVFEELLLMKLNYHVTYSISELLLVISCVLKLESYQSYYWLKFPTLQEKFGQLRVQLESTLPRVGPLYKPPFFMTNPPSVIEFISKIVTSPITTSKIITSQRGKPVQEVITERFPCISGVTDQIQIIISLFCEMYNMSSKLHYLTCHTGHRQDDKKDLAGSIPIRSEEADRRVVELLVRFGKDRDYLTSLPEGINLYLWDSILNCRESPPTDWSDSCFKLIGRIDLVNLVRGHKAKLQNRSKSRDPVNTNEDDTLKLIFPDDIRVSEAHRMLASDTPVEFSVTQRQGATDEETREETHRHLYLLNVRTMAMSLGRGAICLRTYSPVIGESCEAPTLELSGKTLSDERLEYTHDVSVYPWPYFHNGVAAGLKICASTANNIIDSTWINYNRPRSNPPHGTDMRDRDFSTTNINNQHAGFLFALGLNGHLEKLSLMALHDYLCQNNDLTKLAILLGMSAAKRGSRDNNIIKVLSIHVDALLPPNSTELDVPAPVHAASIIGVGLLYQGSGDSHISKVLLEEIGRLPGPETNSHIDRESYSLSAGLSFGLVNLCKGGSTTITSSDQLRLYMLGGKRKPLTAQQRERYFKQDCHRGEEEYINTHITSPGGTLGLGLMYHRSGNKSVAEWMRPPDTQTLLEYVRPDFLILRMLSYGLIMWNEIDPSEEWIDSMIPQIVSTHAFQKNTSANSVELVDMMNCNSNIDYELISQAYCNIVAGCCMAIALRYAGTANQNAYKTIYKHTKMLIALTNKPTLADQAGRPCIEACLNVLVTSLVVVMAGTGDLGVMRVCRYLRSRLTQSCVFYGSYMAVHMALGLLFLGACRYSLSTSPESIGALVCALYPIYPNHTSDNRYHLQALRHLYVLAVEPRLLIPRDILTDRSVYAQLRIELKDGKELRLRAPCLVPEVESIKTVCIDDNRYWKIEINDKKTLIRCLFQDRGYLSVKLKAHSSENRLVQNIEEHILRHMDAGVIKSRKSSALTSCVREDRVEQYSALNILLTKSREYEPMMLSIILEQIQLASTLNKRELNDKINLLKPVVGEFDDEFREQKVEENWIRYLLKETDWTNTPIPVAHFIVLNALRSAEPDDDLLEAFDDEEEE